MTERVAERIRRLLRDQPDVEIRFTDGIRADSYHFGPGVLYLHPMHRSLVDQLRSEPGK